MPDKLNDTLTAPPASPDAPSSGRRKFLLQAAAGSLLAAGATATQTRSAHAAVKTSAHIVIAGSGLGGIAIANRLHRDLEGARITIIDRKEEHNYQPGYTLVATGIWPMEKVQDRNADFLPPAVDWVHDMVAGFDPASNSVTTESGKRIVYDFLVVATGLHLDFAAIEGMDVAAIGRNGLACVYPSPQAAAATWAAMAGFCETGGEALMTLPATPLKCAGAPLKMTFMLADRLISADTFKRSNVNFHSALPNVFGVPQVNAEVLARWKAMNIPVHFNRKLASIDIGQRRATFVDKDGAREELGYDFIHVVPPMRAPDAVKNSDLAWQQGPFAAGGWLEVDKKTLRHVRYPNVFGIGDINGTPRGKTAATVKKSAPIVATHITDIIAGREPSQEFDGYTSCPLLVREGAALLVEFDYEGRLIPSLPMVDPLQDSWFAWLMKYRLLKPAYVAVLKGRV